VSPVIDIHAHVIAADTARYPRAPIAGEQSGWSRERPVDREQMLGAMDAAGVARMALVQASTCYGHDNAYVADSAAAHPERCAGVFSVDVFQPDAVEKIRHWAGRGLAGLRVFIAGHTAALQDLRLDDPRSFPAWQCAETLGIPVCVQMRAPALSELETILERFARVTVILDHCARPALEDGPPYRAAGSLFRLARHDNLRLKLTTHNVRESRKGKATPETFFAKLVERFGADRIAWGSNFPASEGSLAGILAEAKSALASLAEGDRDWIFSRTAQRLYPSLAESAIGAASRWAPPLVDPCGIRRN
jgi:predicted TIM-barrel fold metal-dependent hydrolase